MKKSFKKWGVALVCGMMVAALGMFGCSSGSDDAAPKADADLKLVKEGVLTVGTSPDYPPFENLENGEYVGLDIEIAKAIAKEMGLEIEFKTLQFDGILPAVAAGGQVDFGISGITVDPERAQQVNFSTSYYIDDLAVAVMKGGAITADNVDAELNKEGMIIAVQSGTTGEVYAQENYPNAKVQPYGNSTDAFAAMQSGQANAVITNKAVVEKMLAEAYKDAEVVKPIATGEEYAIAISKENAALLEQVNAAIKKLDEAGTLKDLVNQYLG